MRLGIVSGGRPPRYRSYINHGVYALKHGHTYIRNLTSYPNLQTPNFHKLHAVADALPAFDWVLWLDDDAFFTDFERDIAERPYRSGVGCLLRGLPEPDKPGRRLDLPQLRRVLCQERSRNLSVSLERGRGAPFGPTATGPQESKDTPALRAARQPSVCFVYCA